MTEPAELDFQKLQEVSWRAILSHHLSEHEMVVVGRVIMCSFAIGRPFAWIQHVTDLVAVSGIPKNKIYKVLQRLETMKALEKAQVGDGYILTLLPPSEAWPWIADARLNSPAAVLHGQRVEAQLIHATKHWPTQTEFFPPPVERELADALAIERMRESLRTAHRAAAEAAASGFFGCEIFPVTDRLPTPAPALMGLSVSEGHTRPQGTGQSEERATCSRPELPHTDTRRNAVPCIAPETVANSGNFSPPRSTNGSLLGTRAGPEKGPALIESLSVSKSQSSIALLNSENSKSRGSRKGTLPPVEMLDPLDPGAGEEEMVKWLRYALGLEIMDQWGGSWREAIRANRLAVLNACYDLRIRVADLHQKPLRNRGGWLRDRYRRIAREMAEESADTCAEA